jgi:hypothetical protein
LLERPEDVESLIANLRARGEQVASNQPVTVVLDQLDESPLLLRLERRLQALLNSEENLPAFRFLIGCRTADYPPALTNLLETYTGSCRLADLAPLTREQAVELAESAGVSGSSLVEAATERGAAPLAATPLTLGLLVGVFREEGELVGGPIDLFEKGVRLLLDEWNRSRAEEDPKQTSVPERLAIAQRIAAHLLLSGRRSLWRGNILHAAQHDLLADQIVGGTEQLPNGPFDVDLISVGETLRTALFSYDETDRARFRHSSLAAYLAAGYLHERGLPRRQLEGLLLTSPGDGSRVVPSFLRETAAWLVALDPSSSWLIEVDPVGFAAYSPLIEPPQIRKLIVEQLLDRAAEVELDDRAPVARRLWHPSLGEQLAEALSDLPPPAGGEWPTRARARLALRLAEESGPAPEVLDPILQIAEDDRWNAHVRQLASRAGFTTDPDIAAGRLADILRPLGNDEHATAVDPEDELRGTLLDLLWPQHVSTEDVLPLLRARRKRNLLGSYAMFLHNFPSSLSEADLPVVLPWAAQASASGHVVSESGRRHRARPGVRDGGHAGSKFESDVLLGVANRALRSPQAVQHLDQVAEILWPFLAAYGHPSLPDTLDWLDEQRREPGDVRDLRHGLAVALFRVAQRESDDMRFAWILARDWKPSREGYWNAPVQPKPGWQRAERNRLLGSADFEWSLHAAAEAFDDGDSALGKSLAHLAAALFDPEDTRASQLAFDLRETPAGQQLQSWFEPMSEESDAARHWRDMQDRRARFHEEDDWDPEPFVGRLHELLEDAAGGGTDAFWKLAHNLQFDPATGRGPSRFDDDLLDFPGIAALGPDAERLREAATHFVLREHDRADEWLSRDWYDKRAWAGYLALALLQRSNELETAIPPEKWAEWAGAVVWFRVVLLNGGDRDLKTLFLEKIARQAPATLVKRLLVYVRGELARGDHAWEVELVDPAWSEELADAFAALLDELRDALLKQPAKSDTEALNPGDQPEERAAPPERVTLPSGDTARVAALDLWEELLVKLFTTQEQRAVAMAEAAVGDRSSANARMLAVRAGRALLHCDVATFWPWLIEQATADEEFGKQLALASADRPAQAALLTEMDETGLADVYRWLSSLFPRSDDVDYDDAHWVGPEEEAQQWRDRTLRALAERGTREAVSALAALADEFPDRLEITANLVAARTKAQAKFWTPPSPKDLAELFADSRRRLVNTEEELAVVVLDTLQEIHDDMTDSGAFLWDMRVESMEVDGKQHRRELWRPKPEAMLSNYLAQQLNLRLVERGLVVNREVMVHSTNAAGAYTRVDLQADTSIATGHAADRLQPATLRLRIEVKGAWHDDVKDAQRDQLAAEYLREAGPQTGIYLVGWYPPELWNDQDDSRKQKAARHTKAALEEHLERQAEEIQRKLRVRTHPYVLEVPRPHKSDELQGPS